MKNWKKVKLGSLITESKIVSEKPNSDKRISVRLNVQGVEKRPNTKDKKGSTKYFIRKAGQFIYGKQNLHKGAFGIVPKELDGFESSLDIPAFDVNEACFPEWIFYFFLKGNFYLKLESIAKGVGSKRIHPKQIFELDIFLPSKEEQRKVLDEIKKAEINNQALIKEMDLQEESLKKLRQSILQDATQGKLTIEWRAQNESIEPASILLKRINKEKENLVSQQKIKDKKTPNVSFSELFFEVPDNWEWVKLGDISEFISSGSRNWAKYYSNSGAKFIRMGNLSRNSLKMRLENIQYVDLPRTSEGKRTKLQSNDYLVSITGDVGMLGKVPDNFGEAYINQHTAMIRLFHILQNGYIDVVLLSPLCIKQFNAPQRGVKNSFRLSDLKEIILPFPPLEEQDVIVKKVTQLLANCDVLEQELIASKTNAEKLVQTVLCKLLGEEKNNLIKKVQVENVEETPSREIKYNSKTINMKLVELLKINGELHAEDLWQMSEFYDKENENESIDKFYSELKKQIEQKKTIRESSKKGYLELL